MGGWLIAGRPFFGGLLPALMCVAVAGSAHAAWDNARTPSAGAARVHGTPTAGCIGGAAALPLDGLGYQAIRPSRRRHFGHPSTVDFVRDLGAAAARDRIGILLVGDMAQPRGGPMAYGHASHQTGLDVDIWFRLDERLLPPDQREDLQLPSMVRADGLDVDPRLFTSSQVALLRLAARDARVDRIFVNPAIKRALCRMAEPASRVSTGVDADWSWLRRIRPWRGHDAHFHVRLVCPSGSPGCVAQDPVPAGTGCGSEIESWFERLPGLTVRPQRPPAPPRPKMPAACAAILKAPAATSARR